MFSFSYSNHSDVEDGHTLHLVARQPPSTPELGRVLVVVKVSAHFVHLS